MSLGLPVGDEGVDRSTKGHTVGSGIGFLIIFIDFGSSFEVDFYHFDYALSVCGKQFRVSVLSSAF